MSFSAFYYLRVIEPSDRNNFGLSTKISAQAFLISDSRNEESRQIEIFSINKGIVIKKAPSSVVIQNEVIKYLNRITGLYVKVKALPDKGYIIKVPIEPPLKIQTEWLDNLVSDVFIIFPDDKTSPYLLILDDKNRPYFYTFDSSTEMLLKELNLTDILSVTSGE